LGTAKRQGLKKKTIDAGRCVKALQESYERSEGGVPDWTRKGVNQDRVPWEFDFGGPLKKNEKKFLKKKKKSLGQKGVPFEKKVEVGDSSAKRHWADPLGKKTGEGKKKTQELQGGGTKGGIRNKSNIRCTVHLSRFTGKNASLGRIGKTNSVKKRICARQIGAEQPTGGKKKGSLQIAGRKKKPSSKGR